MTFILQQVFCCWPTCLKHNKLDPVPGIACQALLKTAAEYCEHKKNPVKSVNYGQINLGFSCFQT